MSTDAEENRKHEELLREVSDLKEIVKELTRKIITLEDKVDTNTINTEGLIDAWKTAKGISGFVRWASTLAIGAGILWTAIVNHKF